MENTVKKYNEYKENKKETWKKRFTWQGLNGREPKHTTSILRFNDETNAFEKIGNDVCTSNKFFEEVSKIADEYVGWVNTKEHEYNERELEDMRNFFVGAIGEWFYYKFVTCIRNVLTLNENGESYLYYFSHVSPTLVSGRDAGVDFTSFANDVSCAMQVKFWNPFDTKRKVDAFTMCQKAYADGVIHGFVDASENNTVFVCWLGDESAIYNKLGNDKAWKNKVVVLGKKCLDMNINNKCKNTFWKKLKNGLCGLKTDMCL